MNRKLTVFLPFFMILAILLTLGAGAAAFEDVPDDAYFAPAVQWALETTVSLPERAQQPSLPPQPVPVDRL